MPRTKSQKSTLFVSTDGGWCEVGNSKTEIYVGIWWHNGQQLIGFAQPVAAVQQPRALVDSDLSHADAWGTARRQLSCSSDVEYFEIPRGRFLWHTDSEMGILYHGNGTQAGVHSLLAELFGILRWEALLDEHYLTGDALDACMNQE